MEDEWRKKNYFLKIQTVRATITITITISDMFLSRYKDDVYCGVKI
jgi:hypothetical protein